MKADASNKFNTIVVYVDGAGCRPDCSGSGYAWKRLDTNKHRVFWKDGLTNNEAEYHALILALRHVLTAGWSPAVLCGDSMLVIAQMSGRWQVKTASMIALRSEPA